MVEFGILNLQLLAIPYLLLDKGHVLVARCSANEPRANETGVKLGGVWCDGRIATCNSKV